MKCSEKISLKGRVEIVIFDTLTGRVTGSRQIDNLIVDMGKNYYARKTVDGTFTSVIRQVALGKGVIPPYPTDTNLGNPLVSPTDVDDATLAIATATRSNPTSKMSKFVAVFPEGTFVTTSDLISELVLVFDTSDRTYSSGTPLSFTADGGIFARVCGTFPPFGKSVSERVTVTWYTETEYAVAYSDCSCCHPQVVQLPDQATIPIDLTQGDIFELRTLSQTSEFAVPMPIPSDGKVIEIRIASGIMVGVTFPASFFVGITKTLPVPGSTYYPNGPHTDVFKFEYSTLLGGWRCIDRDVYNSIAIGQAAQAGIGSIVIGGIEGTPNINDGYGVAIGNRNVITAGAAVGIGQNIVSRGTGAVALGFFTYLGHQGNDYWASSCVGMGEDIFIGQDGSITGAIGIGNIVHINSGSNASVALGQSVHIYDNSNGATCIGESCQVGSGSNGAICIGLGSAVGNLSANAVAMAGSYAAGIGSIAVGSGAIADTYGIAIGTYALAGPNEAMIGGYDMSLSADVSIKTFTVMSSPVITFQANDHPSPGDLGILVSYNDGFSTVNRTVKATSGALPPGALSLYIES